MCWGGPKNEVWLLSGLRVDRVLERFREKVGIVYVFFSLAFYNDGFDCSFFF